MEKAEESKAALANAGGARSEVRNCEERSDELGML